MKAIEVAAAIALGVGALFMVLVVVFLAALPYAAVLAVLLVCARYLGWF